MLNEIEIENFRCFEQTKISGFGRVNLIGGKNNSGKTALLEALYLFCSPLSPASVLFLMQHRKESFSICQNSPERIWSNFFFQHKIEKELKIYGKFYSEIDKVFQMKLFFQKQTKSFDKNTIKELITDSSNLYYLNPELPKPAKLKLYIKYSNSIISDNAICTRSLPLYSSLKFDNDRENNNIYDSIKKHSITKQLIDKEYNEEKIIPFLPSNYRINNQELATKYDQAVLNNQASAILSMLQILDPAIEEIRTISLGEPTIYLRRKGEELLPISLFGDAINRVIDIVISLIDVKNGIVLIDEIENGIHYLNQREVWDSIFKLAKELDLQIFATTHSLEMINAFADVGLNYKDDAAYFEMARHHATNQIIGIKRDIETLDYVITHNKGVGLRGE